MYVSGLCPLPFLVGTVAVVMFELLEMQDLVEILPAHMPTEAVSPDSPASADLGLLAAVESSITAKYAFRVVSGTRALCVGLAEVLRIGLARLSPGSASAWVGASFTLIVFRPRTHERIKARIAKQDATGVYLTTDFFPNIFVPAHLLKDPSIYDVSRRQWKYLPDEGETTADASPLLSPSTAARQYASYDDGAEVVFAVHAVTETEPDVVELDEQGKPVPAKPRPGAAGLIVQGSFTDPLLGPLAWFDFAGKGDAEDVVHDG
jgi:DNA-directed RNA polymerase subunit E'/Rpb7